MTEETEAAFPPGKWAAIALLALCEVLAMALWFSATAILPALQREFALSSNQSSLITSSVSAGFVIGTFLSAVLGLADRFDSRRFFMCAVIVAASANISIQFMDPAALSVPLLRFIVGACMAGVYPVGMKMASTWARGDTGFLVGLLVGALTLGTASPHLIGTFGGIDWRFTLTVSSILAALSGVLILFFRPGPLLTRPVRFEAIYALRAWTEKPLRLANLGYFGHMWELYAMWTWIGVFLNASFALRLGGADAAFWAKLLTFATIGAGGAGCLLGGLFADRLGRTTLTMLSMAVSGVCALLAGFFFGGNPWAIAAFCLVWGLFIVADSAQFSASVIELSDSGLVGTMVTVQTCTGFLLTMLTIHMIPVLSEALGWRYAFAVLAAGPFLGVWAMARLRAHPESIKLAGGNR
ncbi:MAG: MFS transporter [bacterium]|nr:MFS transporter [bacterium]